jgi:hypothetical protein
VALRLLRDGPKGDFMAKRHDDMDLPQQEPGGRFEDTPRGIGSDEVRGIARDEDDDFDDADDLDDADDDDASEEI